MSNALPKINTKFPNQLNIVEDGNYPHQTIIEEDSNLDYLGILASTVCLIHCLVLPFILPYLSLYFETSEESSHNFFHLVIFPILLVMAISAILKGHKLHNKKLPLTLATLGILLLGSTITFELEKYFEHQTITFINILGSLSLISAHITNISLSFKHKGMKTCNHKNCGYHHT